MKKENLFVTLILLQFIFGCANNSEKIQAEKEEIKMRKSISKMLTDASGKVYTLMPKDTVLELDNETDIVLWKESFINQDSNTYTGKVSIDYAYTNEPRNLIGLRDSHSYQDLINVFGLIHITVKDSNQNALYINPKYSTVLRFHPKLLMNTATYFWFDSTTNKYTTPIFFHEKKEIIRSETGYPSIKINLDFTDTVANNRAPKEQYNRHMLTKSEIIGYEMTIKNFGHYYISRKDKASDLQDVQISLQVITPIEIEWTKINAFVFTNQKDYNYYLKTENIGSGAFKVNPPSNYSTLQLPLDAEYTVLVYGIIGDKCYYFKKKLKLSSSNMIKVELVTIPFSKLVQEIKEL